MEEFLETLMARLDFPSEARETFRKAAGALEGRAPFHTELQDDLTDFLAARDNPEAEAALQKVADLGGRAGIPVYTMHMLFLMLAARRLREAYRERRIPEDIFWNSMADLSCKLRECREVYGIWGTFVAGWFPGFYQLRRFGLGRLQFERDRVGRADYARGGHTLRRGDRVYQVHIPSAGPLTRENRMDSYRRAYDFFRSEREGKPLALICESWLLYPENERFFPPHSHIVDFMHDFEIVESRSVDPFADGWRVFGKDYKEPPERLPRKTSLQRAIAGWLQAGNHTGYGVGILLFDGAHIL